MYNSFLPADIWIQTQLLQVGGLYRRRLLP